MAMCSHQAINFNSNLEQTLLLVFLTDSITNRRLLFVLLSFLPLSGAEMTLPVTFHWMGTRNPAFDRTAVI